MVAPTCDPSFWERLWAKTLREQAEKVARRPPNAHLVAELASQKPGRALDAGCGHGAEALWLALQGWQVTAVDFSESALRQGRMMADMLDADVARRLEWALDDLSSWPAPNDSFDLVVCLYDHAACGASDLVARMARGVAVGGTLFMVGHRPIDPVTGAATTAASQEQVSVQSAVATLDPARWELIVAEERPRAAAGTGVDAVIRALRLS